MESEFKAFDRRHDLAGSNAGPTEVAARRLVVAPMVTRRIGDHTVEYRMQTPVAHPASRRGHQSENHACKRRMDSRRIERQPDAAADGEIDGNAADAQPRDPGHDGKPETDQADRDPVQGSAITDRDDQNGADVVEDRER